MIVNRISNITRFFVYLVYINIAAHGFRRCLPVIYMIYAIFFILKYSADISSQRQDILVRNEEIRKDCFGEDFGFDLY